MGKGISNTSRTLKYFKDQGIDCDIVERWIPIPNHPGGGKRRDLFGIIDLVALEDSGVIGVQSCGSSFSEHDKKIMESPMSLKWLECNNRLMLIGWRKVKLKRGGKAMRWQPRTKEYKIEDFK